MISAARTKTEPAQPDSTCLLLRVCVFKTADHAFMISTAFAAYASSPVSTQSRASVWAASASAFSCEQPSSGTLFEPQLTESRGDAVYVAAASGLALARASAEV